MDPIFILLALIPILVLLMGSEWLLARWLGRRVHTGGQTLNNVFIAVGQRAVSSAFGVVPLVGYGWMVASVGQFTWDTGSVVHWGFAFLAVDLAMYLRHRAAHQVALLWAIHAVHHQSTEYNLTVATRLGWVQETLLFAVPLAVLGVPVTMVVPLFLLGNLWQFAQHTELVGRLGWVDRVLMTPSNHRVHHARNPRYLDTNYGNMLLLWDRLLGTWEPETEAPVYGTLDGLPSFDPLENNLAPIRALIAKARRQPTWWEGMATLVMPPGWRATHERFDAPPVVRGPGRVALGALAAVAALVGALGVTSEVLGASGGGALALAVVAALVGAGLVLDGRRVRPQGTTWRARAGAWVLTVAGASTDGPLALLGRWLTGYSLGPPLRGSKR